MLAQGSNLHCQEHTHVLASGGHHEEQGTLAQVRPVERMLPGDLKTPFGL